MTDNANGSFLSRFEKWSELICWILFLFSAVFFAISALRAGDVPGLIGALLFLFACVVFLVPHISRTLRLSESI